MGSPCQRLITACGHLLDELAVIINPSPVRCSQAGPHPSCSSAALASDGLLKGGSTAGVLGRLGLHNRELAGRFQA